MSKTAARRTLTEEVQERVSALMERNEAGTLTPDEVAELDEITVLDQLFTLVRARRISPAPDHAHDGSDAGCEMITSRRL